MERGITTYKVPTCPSVLHVIPEVLEAEDEYCFNYSV